MKAVRLLGWKNDYIRENNKVISPTSQQIIKAVSNILGKGVPSQQYKTEFIKYVNETENKNYNVRSTDEEFINILVKEKMIEIDENYKEEEIMRPKSDKSNIRPSLRKFWVGNKENPQEDKKEHKPIKEIKQTSLWN